MADFSDYIGGSIITGAANLLGMGISSAASADAAREYNKGQMELAKYQNEWNLAQWERENAYNTPSQQMQRYREAGLNPNLIYGQQNLAASSPSAATPNLQPVPKKYGALGKFLEKLDIRSIMQDIDMKDAQIDLIKSQKGYYQELQKNLGSRTEGNTLWNTYFGNEDFMNNAWLQQQYRTNILRYQNLDTSHKFDLDWKTGDYEQWKNSRHYYENNIIRVQSDKYDLEYDLANKYDAQMYRAQIYNLLHGSMAQQVAAKGSLLSGTAAMQKAGLESDKWKKLQDKIISKYGSDANAAWWNAVLMYEKADTWYSNYFLQQDMNELKYLEFDDKTEEEFIQKGMHMVDQFFKFFKKR